MTPEGKVKRAVKKVLAHYADYYGMYEFWPVQTGYGAATLDCLVTFQGRSLFIETKAPKKHPTERQEACIAQIVRAGGIVLVIDTENQELLRDILEKIRTGRSEVPVGVYRTNPRKGRRAGS